MLSAVTEVRPDICPKLLMLKAVNPRPPGGSIVV